jgi:hypothetical protein
MLVSTLPEPFLELNISHMFFYWLYLHEKFNASVNVITLQVFVIWHMFILNQVCLEGEVSKKSVVDGLSRGKRASGDLIPWTIAQQYQDRDFPMLSGVRIVRIATHPDYQGVWTYIYMENTYKSIMEDQSFKDGDRKN